MSRFRCVATVTFALTCSIIVAARAGEMGRGCVELPKPVSLASMKDGADFVASSNDVGNLTVMEVQGNYARGESAIRQAVASRFYAAHPDDYDFLFVFTTFEFDTGDAAAFHNILRNDTAGIGRPMLDVGAAFGSPARLQGYIDMAAMSRYTFSPGSPTYHEVYDTLAHELMHRWGMEVHFVDAAGHDSADLLGRDGLHWSYFLDSDASLMYGNDWALQGDGTFRSIDTRHRYSPLDLYLAGFASPAEVHPFVLIRAGTGGVATDLPRLGATSEGTAETITIDQVIAANGPRIPSSINSQKVFSAALILLTRPGETVPIERLLDLERFRARAAQQMAQETDGRASLSVFTRPKGATVGLPEFLHGSGHAATSPFRHASRPPCEAARPWCAAPFVQENGTGMATGLGVASG